MRAATRELTIGPVPAGIEPLMLAELARANGPVAYILSDGQRIADVEQMLGFAAPDIPVLTLPGWDCLPYDRVSPSADTSARRLAALSGLIAHAQEAASGHRARHRQCRAAEDGAAGGHRKPRLFRPPGQHDPHGRCRRAAWSATASSASPPFARSANMPCAAASSMSSSPAATSRCASISSATRSKSIRSFDPASQRTTGQARSLDLNPMSEVSLTPETISHFRTQYLSMFGAATRDDALYQAVSEGRRYAGMEHWLPLFYDRLDTVFDYLAGFHIVTDHVGREAAAERSKLVHDYYEARQTSAAPGKAPDIAGHALQAGAAGAALSRRRRLQRSAGRRAMPSASRPSTSMRARRGRS